ncbi:MAG: hypothetical protein ABH841_01440 [Candidatus Nealsonbacteria bacterium]
MNKEFIAKFKNICSAVLYGLAKNPLYAVAFLFLIVLALGALIFYQYDASVEFFEPRIPGETIQFQKDLYYRILKERQDRDERFAKIDDQNYINPFQAKREKLILNTLEKTKIISVDSKILNAGTLQEFYVLKGERMPLLSERTKMWQEFGLGGLQSYIGSNSQNQLLLAELKKRLTE